MGKKNGKQPMAAHNDRAKGTSSLSQPAALSSGNVLAQFSSSGKLFAQLNIAVDADTLRVFESHSGQCVGRWTSSNAGQRVSAVEWVELPSSSTSSSTENNEKASRGKKRRKGQHNQEDSLVQDADKSIAIEASTSSNSNAALAASFMEALALGLKDGSILILHPTQSTVIQILSHSSITSAPVSLSFSSSSSSTSSSYSPALLWSSTATGQISVWTLPRLSGVKGRLVAQYDTQCPSCTYLSVRYVSSSQPRVNGHQEEGESSSTNSATTVQILLGQYSIKLFETSLPKITEGISVETVERPQIHLRSECSGHASEIIQLVWLGQDTSNTPDIDNVRFLSIAKGDRFVSLWTTSISSTSTTPASGLLTATLGLDEEPRRLAVAASNSVICAVSSDAARIITIPSSLLTSISNSTTSESSGKHRKRKHSDVKTLKVVSTISPSQSAGPCVDAYLSRDSTSSVVVASGLLKPRLDAITYRQENGDYLPTIEIKGTSQGALSAINGTYSSSEGGLRAVYTENVQSTVLSAEAARDPSTASAPTAEPVDPAAEPTIAERLKELHFKDHRDDMVDAPGTRSSSSKKFNRSASGKKRIADAMSTTQSLVQALHSADTRLLETCLVESNVKVIRATVRRVPDTLVLPLVEALVERLSRTRRGVGEGAGGVDANRGQVLVEWLRNVLIVHLGYLITIPSLVERLSALHATLQSRMSFHSQLLALSGRLDLVVSQIDIRAHPIHDSAKTIMPSQAPKAKQAVPAKKYIEGDESDSSSDSSDEEDDDDALDGVEPAEEGDEEDIEDLVMANGDLSAEEGDDTDDEEDEDDEEDDIPALRKTKASKNKSQVNGFLDVEAEESENEGSDEDTAGRSARTSAVKLNGVIHEDSLDEDDEDDLDRYESDFINDDDEDEDDESGDEEEDGEDEDDE